ncbi:chromate transporter-domain-containing protein [Thelonectria olida]|uniref:Chromate transporter-domain-containing protein n=1 Tax=Thelonectria olida TaxID=1576542 RepID=A0A9P8W5P2_9HYPO|nr:chromate transporter-domain-containing protein [Thelonectria olida]
MATKWWARCDSAKLSGRFWNTIRENWYLGFTSFGGPPVHFKIFHDKFVTKLSWIDEQVVRILSQKAITDTITRVLVFLGATAGMMYNALWYFPLLMFLAGITAVVHDFRWLHGPIKAIVASFRRKSRRAHDAAVEEAVEMQIQQEAATRNDHQESNADVSTSIHDQDNHRSSPPNRNDEDTTLPATEREALTADNEPRMVPEGRRLNVGWKFGLLIILLFLVSFIVVMVLRGTLPNKSRLYSLFANMYLAGTIIFGGGPVVIPLLREYIVAENWVSPRDFLIGLALIQAFPGPNFNFAVYLGSLTAINSGYNSAAGAVLGFLGIFVPGLTTVHGTIGVWNAVRGWRWVKSALRGVNAAAVGLIYTAVYRLWQIGYIDEGFQQGTSLAVEPWWVVVTATSYVGGYWFRVSPPVAIVIGAVMGLIWYGVVSD